MLARRSAHTAKRKTRGAVKPWELRAFHPTRIKLRQRQDVKGNNGTLEGGAKSSQLAYHLALRRLPVMRAGYTSVNVIKLTNAAGSPKGSRHFQVHLQFPAWGTMHLREGQVLFQCNLGREKLMVNIYYIDTVMFQSVINPNSRAQWYVSVLPRCKLYVHP